MPKGIQVMWCARYRLTLLTVFLIVITSASRLSATAATLAASTSLSWLAKADDLAEARRLNLEVLRLLDAGKYDEAIPLAERALAIREKVLGPNHQDVATSLNNLAFNYKTKGDYAKAEPLYKRSLAIREKALGPDHPDVATSLNNLASLYKTKGDYMKAEPLYQRALAIREKALGPDHPSVATSLNNLAALYDSKGDYAKAEPLYQRALAIQEKTLGPDHPDVTRSLNNLAVLYKAKGDYAKAEPLYQRALTIREKVLGPNHPNVATSLNNLAFNYKTKGDYAKAEPLYQRALAINEKALGPDHAYVATSLNNLAALYDSKGDYAKAEPLYQRALVIYEKALGPDHPDVATSLNNLAALYKTKGDYAKAEPLYQRALVIYEKALGPDHPAVATSLNNLVLLYKTKGDYANAEPLYQRALAILEKALGLDHPDVAQSLNNLATLYEAKNDLTRAVAFRLRATDISERNIALNLASGSERQKLLYLATFSDETDLTVSLHVRSAPNDRAARRLALTTGLRRKGRVLDAIADSIGALRGRLNSQDRALLDQLTDTRSRLATLVLGGPGKTNRAQHQAEFKRLEDQVEKLEAEISLRSAEFRVQSQLVTMELIQAAIPRGTALVEFISYYPYNAKKNESGSRSYVAYVLSNQGEPTWVNLGEAEKIDTAVGSLREALRDPDRADVKVLARTVDERVMQPVRSLLSETRALLISPDGALNLIPFGALVDEQNRYLIEQYSLTYLTTGRDLLRMQARKQSTQGAVVVADPDFGEMATAVPDRGLRVKKADAGVTQQTVRNAVDFSEVYFGRLPGTAEEAKALRLILPGATMLEREQATEAALKQIRPPAILHIATHGFFLEDVVIKPSEKSSRGLVHRNDQPGESLSPGGRVENPLLRSGLAMSGANLHKSGNDDGVLTALEVAGLNLWGTKLVVLSACDTGVGEIKNGEGVYGLRRALVLAGSETQVMSLWPVSDEATRDLMIGYYKGLQAGQGRSEALRQVQLSMLKSNDRKHPYYWASFIQSGEWANMDGKR